MDDDLSFRQAIELQLSFLDAYDTTHDNDAVVALRLMQEDLQLELS